MAESSSSLDEKMRRIESLVSIIESCPDPDLRFSSQELLAAVMDLHQEGLAKIIALLEGASNREAIFEEFTQDSAIGTILLLHGLHPRTLASRILGALEQVRPALAAHQGDVELVAIAEHTVHLRLKGTCSGCPSSRATARNLLEGVIRDAAPEVERIEVEGLADPRLADRQGSVNS